MEIKVKDLYDSIAEEYDVYDDTNQLVAEDNFTYGIIRSHSKLNSILDLGCGTGRSIRFLKPEPGEYQGVDISMNMLRMAMQKYPKYTFYNYDFMKYPIYEQPTCVISLFGSPCYTPILDLMSYLMQCHCKIFLGMYGKGRNKDTFEAMAERDVLKPWSAGDRELEIIKRYFPHTKFWKTDLYAPWKQKLPVSVYTSLLHLETRLPFHPKHYAWVLAEIDNGRNYTD